MFKNQKYNLDIMLENMSYRLENVNYDVLCEEEKAKFADGVVTKLFNDIKKKMNKNDYTEINKSKGDVTKLSSYKTMGRALNFLEASSKELMNHEIDDRTKTLKETYKVLTSHKDVFTEGYKSGNELIMATYCGMVQGLIVGVSETISVTVNTVKLGNSKDNLKAKGCRYNSSSIEALKELNALARDGKIRSTGEKLVSRHEAFDIVAFGVVAQATIACVILILKSLRSITFAFYHRRIKIAEHLRNIAEFVDSKSDRTMDKTLKGKQEKWRDTLIKFADKVDVDTNKAEVEAKKDVSRSEAEIGNMPTEWLI